MSLEQQLSTAFRTTERIEPSPDLWPRVVHSIDEDRAHRRRVLGTTAVGILVLAAVVAVGLLSLRDVPRGRAVPPAVMFVLELAVLAILAVALGPAIRRFGRNFAEDLWPAAPRLAHGLLRLLDIAYGLVFAGYILLTTPIGDEILIEEQLSNASLRIGGLLLLMGVLHAITLVALPVVALIDNSTRRGRALPRWLKVAGSIAVVVLLVPQFPNVAWLFTQ